MDRDENLYFDNFGKLSLDEIKTLFQNLKHIGLSEEQIEKYAEDYKKFFEIRKTEEAKMEKKVILIGDHEKPSQ
jgi:hypothetical protein